MEKLTLVTGGSGLLGSEIKRLEPKYIFPSHSSFNITNYIQLENFISSQNIGTIIHSAALISAPICLNRPIDAISTNIIGTAFLTQLCIKKDIRLIYISTDYVFDGKRGMYTEEDPVLPVNAYAWSKLGGECSIQLHPKSLIIRLSFSTNEFPHPKAFIDQWTTRETVSNTAPKIIKLAESNICGIIHIGGQRQTAKEYAIMLGKTDVQNLSIHDLPFHLPKDTSLDTSKYKRIMK